MIKSILKEYGIEWAVNRSLYSTKLRIMNCIPFSEKLYEKRTDYPTQLELFKIDVECLRNFIRNLTDIDKKKILTSANKASKGIIEGFSSVELNYGYPFDWQMNPLTQKRCDESKKWYEIPDFDVNRGDIKITWEASRFSHFIIFARAYLITDDEKYYRAFSEQLGNWLVMNPYGYGANFKCSQECSLRMINALLAFTVFQKMGVITEFDINNVKELVYRCYRKILNNFFYAYKCIKNNHTISELMGMIAGAWCCKDQKRLAKAYRYLDKVIDEQFTDDGGYKQFSFNYQRLALQDMECILSMSGATGKSISSSNRKKISNAAVLMYQCQDENGEMPNYGSNDGALVFPVTSCNYRDFKPVINSIYALTEGKQLYDRGKHQEELIWFSGGRPFEQYEMHLQKRISSCFEMAGLFTLRRSNSWMMTISNNYHSRPGHMDQNHIDLWINGKNVLCDAGTYSYASDIGKELVKNENHNTILVDGIDQMNSYGPFMVYNWTKRKIGKVDDTKIESIVFSKNGYSHRRRMEIDDRGYIVKDMVDKDYIVLFHTPYNVDIKDGMVSISDNDNVLCTVISTGTIETEKTIRSLYYLQKEEITCIRIKGKAKQKVITKIEIKEIEND